jgi:glutaconyl-CoA decarboxylase subunit alpha
MRPYFEKMPAFGRAISEGMIKSAGDNAAQLLEVEKQVAAEVEQVKKAGFPEEKINARGQLTIWQRLNYLVDPGSWSPLHTLYNP